MSYTSSYTASLLTPVRSTPGSCACLRTVTIHDNGRSCVCLIGATMQIKLDPEDPTWAEFPGRPFTHDLDKTIVVDVVLWVASLAGLGLLLRWRSRARRVAAVGSQWTREPTVSW